jgi:nucleotide-binding universal stress UspA family protein
MRPVRTIAVGFDGSPPAEVAVRWALGMAEETGADVFVVHAVGLLERADDPSLAAELEQAVGGLVGESGLDQAKVHWHRSDGDPCSVLERAVAPPIGADLLVVGSRGRGAHSGLLLGSTSLELVEHATVPVVIVPSGREARW